MKTYQIYPILVAESELEGVDSNPYLAYVVRGNDTIVMVDTGL